MKITLDIPQREIEALQTIAEHDKERLGEETKEETAERLLLNAIYQKMDRILNEKD